MAAPPQAPSQVSSLPGGHPVPFGHAPPHHCSDCGLYFESRASLQVHLHYHQDTLMSRWAPNGDVDNNNHTKKPGNTIAAADSSDNQPPTPTGGAEHPTTPQSYHSAPSPYQVQSAPDVGYSPGPGYGGYEYYGVRLDHDQPAYVDYKMHPGHAGARYHPYQHSPRVTSSSPNIASQPTPQPTPSPSPKQCDKCGLVCESAGQLSEHCATAHQQNQHHSNSHQFQHYPSFMPPVQSQKDTASSEILDLDSHKVVYPHPQVSEDSPPASTPMAWQEQPEQRNFHGDVKLFPDSKSFQQDKPPFETADVKPIFQYESKIFSQDNKMFQQDLKVFQQQDVKPFQENTKILYHQNESKMFPPSDMDIKPFAGGQPPHLASPPDFPTTTTPQEPPYRPFEAPAPQITSTLAPAPTGKGAAWKSNEARRPKTYQCTACNKWFTSSGHLKRHYNTTLHKNAVKSSGHPDPATLPISVHHHPTRDPNHPNHKQNSPPESQEPPACSPEPQGFPQQSPQQQQQQQYLPPQQLGFGPPQGFQQMQPYPGIPPAQTNMGQPPPPHCQPPGQQQSQAQAMHSHPVPQNLSGSPPNGQAGPSVHSSLPRGLLTLSTHPTTLITHSMEQRQYQVQGHMSNMAHFTMAAFQVIPPTTHTSYLSTTGDPLPSFEQQFRYTTGTMMMSQNGGPTPIAMSMADPLQPPPFSPSAPAEAFTAPSPDSRESTLALEDCNTNSNSSMDSMSSTPTVASVAPESPAPASPAPPNSPIVTSSNTNNERTEPHRCEQCDKVFNKACYLTQHNRSFHCGLKPFKCARCGKRFPCGASHEEHIAKHAGEKPFKCELCPKQFNHKTDLRRHMCLHSGNKPFTCVTCGKGFIRKDHMIKHHETHRKKRNAKTTLASQDSIGVVVKAPPVLGVQNRMVSAS